MRGHWVPDPEWRLTTNSPLSLLKPSYDRYSLCPRSETIPAVVNIRLHERQTYVDLVLKLFTMVHLPGLTTCLIVFVGGYAIF